MGSLGHPENLDRVERLDPLVSLGFQDLREIWEQEDPREVLVFRDLEVIVPHTNLT